MSHAIRHLVARRRGRVARQVRPFNLTAPGQKGVYLAGKEHERSAELTIRLPLHEVLVLIQRHVRTSMGRWQKGDEQVACAGPRISVRYEHRFELSRELQPRQPHRRTGPAMPRHPPARLWRPCSTSGLPAPRMGPDPPRPRARQRSPTSQPASVARRERRRGQRRHWASACSRGSAVQVRPLCGGCGQPIDGAAVEALGAHWHPHHLCCARCSEPIAAASFVAYQGRPLHEACARASLPRCAICAAPLEGAYLADAWGDRYCPAHTAQLAPCPFCARLIEGGRVPAGDPTPRCDRCLATAVSSPEARAGFDRARAWLRRLGLSTCDADLQFRLVDRHALRRGPHTVDGCCFGITVTTRRPGRPPAITVLMVHGLPRMLTVGACVHELGHVWLRQQGIDALPARDEEGFCELLAWRYFATLGTPEGRYHSRRIEESPHPLYGDGFRRVRALCRQYSFPRLVNHLAGQRRLPDGR